MLERIVLPLVISFVVRQLEKFKESIDWEKVKHDLDIRIKEIVPGSWFDDEACAVGHAAVGMIQGVLSKSSDIKKLLEMLAGKKYDQAIAFIKELILGKLLFSSVPLSDEECKLKSCLMK